MIAESERGFSDAHSAPGPDSKPNRDASALPDDSPEMLRWKADALMEEMMLGAVDVSAGDRAGGPVDRAGGMATPQNPPADRDGVYGSNGDRAGGETPPSASVSPTAPTPTRTPEWRIVSGAGDERAADTGMGGYSSPSSSSAFSSAPASTSSISAMRPTGYESASPNKWQPDFAEPERVDEPRRSAWPGQPEAGAPAASPPPSYASDWQTSDSARDSVRETGAPAESQAVSYVSTMAVMPGGPRRSTLLPRMSEFDAEALSKEIAELHGEVSRILPIGHETAERARHLLDKANTILTSDPMRSAEVEYYMQQVRTIVQRLHQAHRWSNLYRSRLRVYLVAWTLLAMVALGALATYPLEAEAFAAFATGAANDSIFVLSFVAFAGTIMAGTLGGALGALVTMRKHAATDHAFFDRKYGLRGLMLPIIGALAGGLIYLVFGVVYFFAGINPSLNVAAIALPSVAAFVLGFSQDAIYGTRE